jgi:cation transport regulator ChaC
MEAIGSQRRAGRLRGKMNGPLVFAYGSLVSPASAAQTLGEPLELGAPARLRGWRRRWSTVRDNLASEKTFAPAEGGEPFRFCLGLNIEPDADDAAINGALLRLSEPQLERLDLREMRYDRAEVTELVEADVRRGARVIAYVAKPQHHHPEPPAGAVIMASYLRAVEAAFADLGDDQLELYRATTDTPPVEVVEGLLVDDRIPPGNPRGW